MEQEINQHLTPSSAPPKEDESSNSSLGNNSKQTRNAVAEALEDITALFYDEERNEIYKGNRHGFVHAWPVDFTLHHHR
ncbi:hypothetical protein Bca101_097941 [Brassica carinata]